MSRVLSVLALLSFIPGLASGAEAARHKLEVADLRSGPPIEGRAAATLAWAPTGARLGLVLREPGGSGIADFYVEDATQKKRERLIEGKSLSLPDGGAVHASLEGYQWSPDGSALLLTLDRGIALYDLRQQSLRALTTDEAEYPRFSPDGKFVAFVRGGNLFVVDAATAKVSQLTKDGAEHVFNGRLDWVYEEELSSHGGSAYEWSPDSRSIAYIRLDENRVPAYPLIDFLQTPHAGLSEQRYPNPGDANAIPSIHVVDREGKERARVEFGTNEDVYVVPDLSWLPDSQSVAYEILNREQNHLQVRLLSAQSGRTSPLLEEKDPFWINVPDRINSSAKGGTLRFLKNGRFLWLSERSGFNHVYEGSLAGGALVPVTRGNWGVDAVVGVDEEGGTSPRRRRTRGSARSTGSASTERASSGSRANPGSIRVCSLRTGPISWTPSRLSRSPPRSASFRQQANSRAPWTSRRTGSGSSICPRPSSWR